MTAQLNMDGRDAIAEHDLPAFIARFKAFRDGRVAELRYDAFARHLPKMARTMRDARIAARRADRLNASDYNVFEILGVHNYEVTTHSAFLGNLLSPHGSHAQEDLFFRAFVDMLVPPNRRPAFEVAGADDYEVTLEKATDTGFIDIFVEARRRDRRFAIVIENKVGADDQKQQLARYYDYVTGEKDYRDDELLIVYLTPGGWPPTEQSLAPYNRADWLRRGMLMEISYWEHVKTWLEKSLSKVKAPAVAHVLRQYIRTIQHVGKG